LTKYDLYTTIEARHNCSTKEQAVIITVRLGQGDEDLKRWWLSRQGSKSRALKQALRAYLEQEPLEEMLRRVVREEIREASSPTEE
jgi:hypothetical protein